MPRILTCILAAISLSSALFTSYAFAEIIRVPFDQPTIQAGIDAAVTGDTVLVADGTYTGAGNKELDYGGKAITVTSRHDPAFTVIDCEGSGRGFYFHSGESDEACAQGFTVRNGYSVNGGGIYCTGSSPIISKMIITSNQATDWGGGIQIHQGSPQIIDCIISENTGGIGGGVFCYYYSYPGFVNCFITRNSDGGIHTTWNSSPEFINCTVTNNFSGGGGGGFYTGGSLSEPLVRNTILWANEPDQICFAEGSLTVEFSDVEGGWPGEGNLNSDPLFMLQDDYHLRIDSPCVDTGTPEGAPDHDLDDEPRPHGAGYDIGCDEARYDGPVMKISPSSFDVTAFFGSPVAPEELRITNPGTDSLSYVVIPGSSTWLVPGGELSGILPPSDTAFVSLDFHIAGMTPGIESDTFTVASNDPFTPLIDVPVVLEILSPISIEISCDQPMIRRGGNLEFHIILQNLSDHLYSIDAWLEVFLTGGRPHPDNPVRGPDPITLGGYAILEGYYALPIPDNAPLGGAYSLCALAGRYPGFSVEDCFDFYVIP